MAGGISGLVPHIEQCDFIAKQQCGTDLRGSDGRRDHLRSGLIEDVEVALHGCVRPFNQGLRGHFHTNPAPLWSRAERRSLFLVPPTFAGSSRAPLALSCPSHFVGSRRAKLALGWHIVSGANDVTGGGYFLYARVTPTRRFAPPSPPKTGGGMKPPMRVNSSRSLRRHNQFAPSLRALAKQSMEPTHKKAGLLRRIRSSQ